MTEPTQQDGPKFRILVVDDNRDGADSLGMLLKLWGYDVLVVYDGAEAIRAALTYKPDCILSDIGLPGMDGYRLAERLRQEESFKGTPFVAITAYSDEGRTRAAGFDHHLVKPANPDIVEALLRNLKAMGKHLQRVEASAQQQGEVLSEVRDLMKEVKEDVKEIKEGLQADVKELKQELREVKEDVKEIIEELRDVKDDKNRGDRKANEPSGS
jgi:CheY-like chemotaxis protein